jgi:hypothetical protein
MNAETAYLHLDSFEIVGRGVLQAFHVARREADLNTGRQPRDDPVASGIVMRALGPWAARAGRPACSGRFKLLVGQRNHGDLFVCPSTFPPVLEQMLGSGPMGANLTD